MSENQNIHLTPQEIAMCAEAMVEKRLDSLEPALKGHLSDCYQCSEEVRMVADLVIASESQNTPKEAEKVYSINHPVVSILAAAAVLIFVVLYFYPAPDSRYGSTELAAVDEIIDSEQDSQEHDVKTISDDNLYEDTNDTEDLFLDDQIEVLDTQKSGNLLARFSPNEELEKLFENYKSAFRGEAIHVLTPSEISLKVNRQLKWENSAGKSLFVEIFNNEGIEVFTIATSSESVDIPLLEPGLFYWKLIGEEDFDLIFVGKIISEN